MKCIPGKTTRTYCLSCGKQGQAVNFISPMVHMACECGATWRTIASLCEWCHHPSGTPYYCECKRCIGIKRKGAKEKCQTKESPLGF